MKYLLAADGTDPAQHALEFLLEMVKEGDHVIVLACVQFLEMGQVTGLDRQDVDEINDEMRKMATKFVDSVAVKFDEKNVKTRCVVAGGRAETEIVRHAATSQVDLLVIGRRLLSSVERLFLSSVSDYVAQNATCSVFVVK